MTLRKLLFLAAIFSMLVGCGDNYSSGDRVLVSKCSYETGITPPRRFDVVVFKYPGHFPHEGPMEKHSPKNYIKRLLGLPGELLAMFFGRLYHRVPAPNEAPFFDDVKAGVHPNNLWRHPNIHMGDDHPSGKWFQEGKFTILRKPPTVIMSLRRIVYDNDFQAKDLKDLKIGERWNPAADSTWKKDQATGFFSDGKADGGVDWLRYQHLVRPEGGLRGGMVVPPMLILDALDYNTFQMNNRVNDDINPTIYSQGHWVGDLMLEANVEVLETKGEFWFELSKGINRFRCCFDLATGNCSLYREGMDKKLVKLDEKPTRVKSKGMYLLRFANIDARLTVWVGPDLPFGDGFEYDPPEVRGKDENMKNLSDADLLARRGPTKNDLEPASVGSKASSVKVTQLHLWRDIYYRTRIDHPYTDYDQRVDKDHWIDPAKFDTFKNQQFTTMYVQPGHYLCLGDNSQSSSDSRVWGLVPERLMLGRALMVYFPLERVGPIR